MNTPEHFSDAHLLYADGLRPKEIAARLGLKERTVRHWAHEHQWESFSSPEARLSKTIEEIDARIRASQGSPEDFLALDRVTRSLARLRGGEARRKAKREAEAKGERPVFYEHQQEMLDDPSLFRMWLKSRQVGASFTMAWEGLETALKKERDQIYLSASFKQTGVLREYAKKFAKDYYGITLKGTEVCKLPNGAHLVYLAANPATAQSWNGDLYFDEFFWLRQAREIFENASAMATRGDRRITVFSTPSVVGHYGMELWDESRSKIKISRHLTTVIDAIEGGDKDIHLDKILAMYSPEAIQRLFMCQFADDRGSVFTLEELLACVDENEATFQAKPGEDIWAGLDVSRYRDDTSLILLAMLSRPGGPLFSWRERHLFRRMPLPEQESRLKALCRDWNLSELSIDATTIGEHLADSLSDEFDFVTRVRFSPMTKADLVTHAQRVVQERRLRIPFDQRLLDSFIAIKRKALDANVGYEAESSDSIGHADDFWAIALAMYPALGSASERGTMIL